MTVGEFKQLDYPDALPMEYALSQALFDGVIDINTIMSSYSRAMQVERHKLSSQFEEACICINMHLSKHWTGEHKKELEKRMIHIYNKTKTLPTHIYDEEYGYTEEDDKKEEENYNMHFGGRNIF